MEAALGRILRIDPPPPTTVAGRTDAGVHARGQVCHVDVPASRWQALPGRSTRSPAAALVHRLAGVLPPDVRVWSAGVASPGFDARFSAIGRRYAYRVADAPYGVDPLLRRFVVWHARRLDIDRMNAAGELLLGEHDFGAFCRRREGATTIRTLTRLRWRRTGADIIEAAVEADAFCHNMVRALVGALLAVGDGRHPVGWPREVLLAGVRDPAVNVAPAHGLTLEQVDYPPDDRLAARAQAARRVRELSQSPQAATRPSDT